MDKTVASDRLRRRVSDLDYLSECPVRQSAFCSSLGIRRWQCRATQTTISPGATGCLSSLATCAAR